MALSTEQPRKDPPRIVIYAPEGLGKTTFGAMADKPIFIPLEKGLVSKEFENVVRFPVSKTYEEVIGHLNELMTEEHDRATLVIDSLDWLESLIWKKVCAEAQPPVQSIEDVDKGFGKGYAKALDLWKKFISYLDVLNQEKQMTIVLISHAKIARYDNPETDSYDRFTIKLQDGKNISASALIYEYADIILFANFYVGVTASGKGLSERKRAIGGDERILFTQERPAYKAKNRYNLPHQIPFDREGECWNIIKSHVPFFENRKD